MKTKLIQSLHSEGYCKAFGQKTLQDKASALDRINVRRLLIKVKKFVASTSRFLVFEQNTAQTRNRFINTVQPYLEGVQQRQGLYAFKVVMDETNNTPDVIDRNILKGQIFLQPTKTAEFIVIDFNILPTVDRSQHNEKIKLYIYNSNRRIKNGKVLEFNEMFYTNFEPKMKNRFIMNIDGIDSYLIKTANRPTIQFEPVTLDHINVKRKLKGKGEWQDVEITLYDPIVPSVHNKSWSG